MDAIAHAARTSVPGFEHVGISVVRRDGTIETMAATDPFVQKLDHLQYEIGEGPCLDAITEPTVVEVPHVRNDPRWPTYAPRAAEAGLRSQLAVRLYSDRTSRGGLNLYSTERDTIEPDAPHIAELFAVHAAVALGRAREIKHLNEALENRKTIGQAIGILMERYGIDEARAFQFLVRSSQHSNTKLRDVAAAVIRETVARSRQG